MISPRLFDEFVRDYNIPYFKRICGLGLLPVHRVCGGVMPRLKQMVAYEVAAIAVEEGKKNFRIELEGGKVGRRADGGDGATPSPWIPTCARWMRWYRQPFPPRQVIKMESVFAAQA
jgi:hypothetical protein